MFPTTSSSLLAFSIVYLISIQLLAVSSLPNQVKIGILLHEDQYEQEILFKWSIEQVNQRSILGRTKLLGLIRRVAEDDSWDSERKTCDLLENGAIAIIGPTNPTTSQHVGSICDTLDVPHLNVVTKGVAFNSQPSATNLIVGSSYPTISPIEFQSTISVDMSMARDIMMEVFLDVLQELNWNNFVYLYEQYDSLFYLQQHFDGKSLKSNDLNIKVLRFDPTKPYRNVFWSLKKTNIKHIMLDVQCKNLRTVLKHAQQVSMMTEAHSYLIVCLDTQTIDLEDFKHSRSRIIWMSANDPYSEQILTLESQTNEVNARFFNSGFRLAPERLKIESALIHDAIETIAHTLQGVDSSQDIDLVAPVSCKNSKPWPHGSTIVNYMRTSIELRGMTGRIRFNQIGKRSDYVLNVMRLTELGPRIIGNWSTHPLSTRDQQHEQPLDSSQSSRSSVTSSSSSSSSSSSTTNGLGGATPSLSQQAQGKRLRMDKQELIYLQRGDPTLYEGEERDLLVVTSIRNEPYFMNKQTTKIETGNARYEGYAIDLIDELSRLVNFDYVFKEVDDGKYGKFDEEKKEWNGMIREVMIGKADLAIADLSITSSREDAVDFTLPFMSTGISILFKKPTTKELELFSFLSPFENQVWVYVGGAYMGVSLLLFAVGRISPYEWADPHPCRQEDKILRNQFSVSNSFWFTIAAVMQQGSDLAPRSLSTRLVAAIWYFFTLIMISSYTANLAAFLTVEKVVYPIEKAEDLYRHPQHIKYGCVESGSTGTFFQHSKPYSTFRKMYEEMVFMQSNEQGKAEVENGNYAFFMESTSIEYTIERNCNLTQIGGLLDSKGYGIALAKNSTRKRDYRTKLSEAILSLQESGMLEVLKNRWWKEKRGGGACDIDDGQSGESVKELTLANVGGVFVVLGMGITTSLLLCGLELYAKSCRLAAANGTSKSEQLRRRIKFALSLSENY